MINLFYLPKLIFNSDIEHAGLYGGFYYLPNQKSVILPQVNEANSFLVNSITDSEQESEQYYFYPDFFTFYPILVFSGKSSDFKFGISTDPDDTNYICAVTSALTIKNKTPAVVVMEINASFINRWNELEFVLPSFLEFWKNNRPSFPKWWQPPTKDILDERRKISGTGLSLMPLMLPLPLRQYVYSPDAARVKIGSEPNWITIRENEPFVCFQDTDIYPFEREWKTGAINSWGTGVWLTREMYIGLQKLGEKIIDCADPHSLDRIPSEFTEFQ